MVKGRLWRRLSSTYYEQEFVSRSSSVSSLGAQAWTQVPLEVLPWENDQFSRTFTNTLAPAV